MENRYSTYGTRRRYVSDKYVSDDPEGATKQKNCLFVLYCSRLFVPLHPKRNKSDMNGLYTIILLILSNIFMTLAWYGHLKLSETGVSKSWPLLGVIVFSWGIAFFEYCCQVPANRLGFIGNGGPFSLVQLKVVQECISLFVFAIIANIMFQGQQLHWNHILAFIFIVLAVYLVFMK